MTTTKDEALTQREKRKREHLSRALEMGDGEESNGFQDINLIHQAIPGLDTGEISTSSTWLGKELELPLIINALTGGIPESLEINRQLARVSRKCGLAMAVGSQVIAFENPAVRSTFQVVREENPDGLILANVGAGVPLETALQAIEMINADALQLHLNVAQELSMAEGDRSFRHLLDRIGEVVRCSRVPVIVKETGCGLSRESVIKLYGTGVRIVDVGGKGGTNFIAIEQLRTGSGGYPVFCSWGLPTVVSLLEALSLSIPVDVLASGGIRNPLEACKALVLGARLVGVAGPFLRLVQKGSLKMLVEEIVKWKQGITAVCLMVGASNLEELRRAPVVITGETLEWAKQRGLQPHRFSRR